MYPYVPLLVKILPTRFESVAKELTEMLVSTLWRWVETNDIKYLYESFKYFSPINAVLIYAGLNKPSQLIDWLVKQDYEFKGKTNNIYIYVKEIPNGLIMFQVEKVEGKPLSEEAISFIATLSGVLTHVHHVKIYDEYKVDVDVGCENETIQRLVEHGSKLGLEISTREMFKECDKLGQLVDLIQEFEEVEAIVKDSRFIMLILSRSPEYTKVRIEQLFEKVKYRPPMNIVGVW